MIYEIGDEVAAPASMWLAPTSPLLGQLGEAVFICAVAAKLGDCVKLAPLGGHMPAVWVNVANVTGRVPC